MEIEVESPLVWHEQAWQRLQSYIRQERIPHALLIVGKRGVGKAQLARRFAQRLLCSQPSGDGGCGRCQSCHLLQAGTHPDFLTLTPEEEGKEITVGAVRELCTLLSLTPQYGGYRVVIIAPAQRMNTAAANSLLKTLEEPVDQTVMILLSDEPHALLPTIVSRCQRVDVALPEAEVALKWLAAQTPGEPPEPLLAAAQGAPLLAFEMAQNDFMTLRGDLLDTWLDASPGQGDVLDAAERWAERPAPQILFWLTSCAIDMIRLKTTRDPAALFNPDLRARLQAVAEELNSKQLFASLDLLLKTNSLLTSQVNKQLMFEDILLKWQQIRTSHHQNGNYG